MTWTRLSDTFTDRAEMLAISRDARLFHIEAMIYGNRMLTDGKVPPAAFPRFTDAPDTSALLRELVDAGLWVATDDGQWQLDWSDQEQAVDVRRRQRVRNDKQKRYRDRKALHDDGDHSLCDRKYCRAVTGNASHNVTGDVTGDVTHSRPGPSRRDRDRDNGAGTVSASAPTARAKDNNAVCPHHIRGGLSMTDGAFRCGQCEALTPPDPHAWQQWAREREADGLTEQIVDKLSADVSDRDFDIASDLGQAIYDRFGQPRDQDGDLLPITYTLLIAWILLQIDAGYVERWRATITSLKEGTE